MEDAITNLRQAMRQEVEQQLADRSAALDNATQELDLRAAELDRLAEKLNLRAADLDRREADLDARSAALVPEERQASRRGVVAGIPSATPAPPDAAASFQAQPPRASGKADLFGGPRECAGGENSVAEVQSNLVPDAATNDRAANPPCIPAGPKPSLFGNAPAAAPPHGHTSSVATDPASAQPPAKASLFGNFALTTAAASAPPTAAIPTKPDLFGDTRARASSDASATSCGEAVATKSLFGNTQPSASSSLFPASALGGSSLFQPSPPPGVPSGSGYGGSRASNARAAMAAALAQQEEEEDEAHKEDKALYTQPPQPATTVAVNFASSSTLPLFGSTGSASSSSSATNPCVPGGTSSSPPATSFLFGGGGCSSASTSGGTTSNVVRRGSGNRVIGGSGGGPGVAHTDGSDSSNALWGGWRPSEAPSRSAPAAEAPAADAAAGFNRAEEAPSVGTGRLRQMFERRAATEGEATAARRKTWTPVTHEVPLPASAKASGVEGTIKVNATNAEGGTAYRPNTVFNKAPPRARTLQELLNADEAKAATVP